VSVPGYLENLTVNRIAGWAWNAEAPDDPVEVAVSAGADTLLTIRADQFRRDLLDAGIGNGKHGFSVTGLHDIVPWSLREVEVRRLPDGAALNGSPGALIATAGPHVLLYPGNNAWFVSLGNGAYAIPSSVTAVELATYLPIGIKEPSDDDLPILGEADLVEDPTGATLVLQRAGTAAPLRLSLPDRAFAGPYIRWCRGAPGANSWARSNVVFEVENTLGLELTCFLPEAPDSASKLLTIVSDSGTSLQFQLIRGGHSQIAFRVPLLRRHRVRIATQSEPGSELDRGFELRRFDAITPPFDD
jgi:hypothetical protein